MDLLSKNRLAILISGALMILLIIFVIRPTVIGYSTYATIKESNYSLADYSENIQNLRSKLDIANTNLSACYVFSEQLLEDSQRCADKYIECHGNLNAAKITLTMSASDHAKETAQLNSQLASAEATTEQLQSKLDTMSSLKQQYDLLAEGAANNICCKAKVDDPEIRYYSVDNNRIVCLREGTLMLRC